MSEKISLKRTAFFLFVQLSLLAGTWYGWQQDIDGVRNLVIVVTVVQAIAALMALHRTSRERAAKDPRGVFVRLRQWMFVIRLTAFAFVGAWFMVFLLLWIGVCLLIGVGLAIEDAKEREHEIS